MPNTDFEIAYFADHPEFLQEVAEWLHAEWGWQNPGDNSVGDRLNRMKRQMSKDQIPLMFVAFDENGPLGTTWLVKHDMDTRMNLSPWLATVFVRPEARSIGIGTALVKKAMTKLQELHVPRAYLVTPDKQGFYAQFGWEILEETMDRGRQVFVMTKAFDR